VEEEDEEDEEDERYIFKTYWRRNINEE
jgi:hypothetical protein